MAVDTDRKPILLTVDDDPGVSRAVARDLRRQYGEAYRVVRTESGPQALETLRELKLRGDLVAVLLADHRMPEMTGLEFLEEAMDLFPHARRALLTAYADTDAAIEAINVVDLDHYLLKPWDPPEEKLYPVVDSLIELWRERRAARHRDPGRRSPLVRPLVRGSRLPRPQLGAVPLALERGARGPAAAGGRRCGGHQDPVGGDAGQRAPRRSEHRRAGGEGRAVDDADHRLLRRRDRRWRARPGSAPRCTPRRRVCAPCWSSGRRPEGRRARALASRTTSASPTG